MKTIENMSKDETGYQGWTNYETWAVKLWIDNDQTTQEFWLECARHWKNEPSTSDVWSQAESAKFNLADLLKDQFEEANPIKDASVYADLMNAALSEVNWVEIAENLLSED
jgi:hypothetical protein